MYIEKMTSILGLFNNQNIQYFAGPIQRNFDWIMKDFEKYYRDLIYDTDIKSKKPHFMNTVVVKPLEGSKLLKYTSLTNGQQRMTTTYLHICAICAYVKNNEIPKDEFDYESIRDTLLVNPTQNGDEYYKLLLRKKDRDTLKRIVDELPAHLSNKAGSSKIITAYNYLYGKLNKFNYQETFDKLFLMTTAPIIVEPHDDENTIFNDINSTGRKLSLFDQVRSHCLGNFNLKDAEELEERYFDKISKNKSPNSVITSFVIFKLETISNHSAYNNFINFSSDKNIKSVILELSDFYKIYHTLETSNTGNEDIDYLLSGLNLIYPKGQFTAILRIYSFYLTEEIDLPTLKNCLKLLLSIGLRWKLKVKDTLAFRSLLEWDISWIKPNNLYNTIYKKLTNYFITDTQFEMIIADKNFYRGNKKEFEEENKQIPSNINKITDYLLMSIENYHYPKGRINFEDYSKEHICPQTLDNGWEHFFNEETHHDNVHRLGNITLTAYNSEYSNLSFDDKKNMKNGFEDDKLHLNKCICSYYSWTVDSIQQRTELMAKELCEIFSIPPNTLQVKDNINQSILVGGK